MGSGAVRVELGRLRRCGTQSLTKSFGLLDQASKAAYTCRLSGEVEAEVDEAKRLEPKESPDCNAKGKDPKR